MEKKQELFYIKETRRPNGSLNLETVNNAPSMTDQQYAEDCDANTVIERFTRTGQLTHMAQHQGQYMDLASMPDFQSAMETVGKAKSMFEELPAFIREKFHQKPELFVEYLNNPKNDDEAIELGLKVKIEKTKSDTEQIVDAISQLNVSQPQSTNNPK